MSQVHIRHIDDLSIWEHARRSTPRLKRAAITLGALGFVGVTGLLWALSPNSQPADGLNIGAGDYILASVTPKTKLGKIAPLSTTSQVVDRTGKLVLRLHGPEDRVLLDYEQISPYLKKAVLAIEDRRFLEHDGLDLKAIVRAFGVDLAKGSLVQGGSTITQQLVKNSITGSDKTWQRKVKEASLSVQMESTWSKEEILTQYLNTIYLGSGRYGAQSASRYWFNKDAKDLTLTQAALLAGMIQAPSAYNPETNPDKARERRNVVLDAMAATGDISEDEAEEAKGEPLGLNVQNAVTSKDAVTSWLIHNLQHDNAFRALGKNPQDRADTIFTGGITIHTTIDPIWQNALEGAIAKVIPADSPVQAAAVAIDPDTGEIKAMVSGTTYEQRDAQHLNLATQAKRQPGSSFKPIVLATALKQGMTLDDSLPAPPSMVLPDPTNPNGAPWNVSNAGGIDYGALDLRAATAFSANTVFAQLIERTGIDAVKETAKDLGVRTELPDAPSIALGSGEVTVLDMASVQATFASGGIYHAPTLISHISQGQTAENIIWSAAGNAGTKVLDTDVAWAVTRAMTAVITEGTGLAATINRPLAGKTGTTQNNADAWFTAFTRDVALAVWVGDVKGQTPLVPPFTPIAVNGSNWPAMIAKNSFEAIESQIELRPFVAPDGETTKVWIDKTRSCLPNQYTPANLYAQVEFPKGQEPTKMCSEPREPQRVEVPNVIGIKAEEGKSRLLKAGIIAKEYTKPSVDIPPGVIIEQYPTPGLNNVPDFNQGHIVYARKAEEGEVPADIPAITINTK